MPNVNFCNLKLTHIQAPDEFKNVARRAAKTATDTDYLRWINKTVASNTDVGENVLVVAHKRFCDQLPDRKLFLDGRTIYVTHWGTGIGSNEWRHCTSVFLFAELHLPRSVYISTAAAMNGGILTSSDLEYSRVKKTGENFRLHQLKQLGCRGLVRNIDADGKGGEMKLFTSMDRDLFIRGYQMVFPNTGTPKFIQSEISTHQTKGERLAQFLLGYNGPDLSICSSKVAEHLGIKVSEVATAFKSAKCKNLAGLGWSYVPGQRSVSKPMIIKVDLLSSNPFLRELMGPPVLVAKKGSYMDEFKLAA